jgi:hypothetical protein
VQDRCIRNRKRSKRRAVYCPTHGCYLDSVSPKFPLFADSVGQLQQRGVSSKKSRLLMTVHRGAVPLTGEWIEQMWCSECQRSDWYQIRKVDNRLYEVRLAPLALWKNAARVINPYQNPSVSEFTVQASRNSKASF